MINVSYVCEVISVVMGKFNFRNKFLVCFFDADPFVHHCVFR